MDEDAAPPAAAGGIPGMETWEAAGDGWRNSAGGGSRALLLVLLNCIGPPSWLSSRASFALSEDEPAALELEFIGSIWRVRMETGGARQTVNMTLASRDWMYLSASLHRSPPTRTLLLFALIRRLIRCRGRPGSSASFEQPTTHLASTGLSNPMRGVDHVTHYLVPALLVGSSPTKTFPFGSAIELFQLRSERPHHHPSPPSQAAIPPTNRYVRDPSRNHRKEHEIPRAAGCRHFSLLPPARSRHLFAQTAARDGRAILNSRRKTNVESSLQQSCLVDLTRRASCA